MTPKVIAPRELRVNGRRSPLGIETHPVLSWIAEVQEQTAYEVQVGASRASSDIWSSGKVTSKRSSGVRYGGPPIESGRIYHWRVRVWTTEDVCSPWSEPSTWEAGLLHPEDWAEARWIGGRDPQSHDWADFTASVTFTGAGDPATGLTFLFRAQPVGKTWGEALAWTVGTAPRLNTTLVEAAGVGSDAVIVRDARGLKEGDVITLGVGESMTEAVVLDAGPQPIDTTVSFVIAPGQIILPGDTPVIANDDLVIEGVSVKVEAVAEAFGAKVLTIDSSVDVARGDHVIRGPQPVRLTARLETEVPANAAAYGRERMRLLMSARHYAGNTGVPQGEPAVAWGENYYDPQSETNPVATGTRIVPIGEVDLPIEVGLTTASWSREHVLTVSARADHIETSIDDVIVDRRHLIGDERRSSGSVGFASPTAAIIRKLTVSAEGHADFLADFSTGQNPLESGAPVPGGLAVGDVNAMLPIANPAPLLRARVRIPAGVVERARLYVAAAGQYEFTVNDEPLTIPDPTGGGGVTIPKLVPDHTSYDRSVLYNSFDVTEWIVPGGDAVLAAELGRGWFGVLTPTEWYWHMANYHGAPRMRVLLSVDYADGQRSVFTSGSGWESTDGPTTYDSVYSGEKFDARKAEALLGWRSGAAFGEWRPAMELSPPGTPKPGSHRGVLPARHHIADFEPATIRAQEHEPVVILETRAPTAAFESAPGSGVWIVDFGQVLTGFPRLTFENVPTVASGFCVRMRGGNDLLGEGSAEHPWAVEHENNFHDSDLQTNYFTLGQQPAQSWAPQFSYWGFRYLEAHNLTRVSSPLSAEVVASMFTVEVARNGFPRTGAFASDNDLLNRIYDNATWAEQNNLIHKPTDTPSREKNGWSGDAMASSESQLLTWASGPFFTKYLRDFPDAMISSGQLPMILPAVKGGYGYDQTPGWSACWSAVPSWDAALFVIPAEILLYTGDDTAMREMYPTQRRLMEYYSTLFLAANDYVYEAPLGEYSSPGDPGTSAVISLQYYIHFADSMWRAAERFGQPDAAHFRSLADQLRRAFIRSYWDQHAKRFVGGQIESENVLALEFDLVPGGDLQEDDPCYLEGSPPRDENRASVASAAADSIRDADDHFQSGVYGARYLFNTLEEFGFTDLLLRAVTARAAPSFADQIARGATSMWEVWGGGSKNHHYRSNVVIWFYQELAGIAPVSPGYDRIRIRPRIPSTVAVTSSVPSSPEDPGERAPLNHVRAELLSVRGSIRSHWRREAGHLRFDVEVPANARAEIWIPTPAGAQVVTDAGVHLEEREWGATLHHVFEVGSGAYTFEVFQSSEKP